MTSYWLAKALRLIGLIVIARIVIRKPRSASHLAMRRLAMLVLIVFACFAVLFPTVLNSLARMIGIERGINLLVYGLVLALFAQMANSYRRDAEAEARLTLLARAVALADFDSRTAARERVPSPACDSGQIPAEETGSSTPGATIASDEHTRHE